MGRGGAGAFDKVKLLVRAPRVRRVCASAGARRCFSYFARGRPPPRAAASRAALRGCSSMAHAGRRPRCAGAPALRRARAPLRSVRVF
jgi:hypothetical protein